jgi:hypothetical protein
MTEPTIHLAELRADATIPERYAQHLIVPAASVLALIEIAEAAHAYLAMYSDEGPHLVTADLNPYSLRGRMQTLRSALARVNFDNT